MSSAICCESVPSSNLTVNGVVVGSTGVVMMVAGALLLVIGWVANTFSEFEKGDGRWRMLSRSALEVKMKEPSYSCLKWGPAGRE